MDYTAIHMSICGESKLDRKIDLPFIYAVVLIFLPSHIVTVGYAEGAPGMSTPCVFQVDGI
jgi:hypothetical protein